MVTEHYLLTTPLNIEFIQKIPMFRKYGVLGIFLILFTQLNFFFKIQPFANWYFPLVWFGYILTIDAIIYKIKRHSLISNRFHDFINLLLLSSLFWWFFEFINVATGNWNYINAVNNKLYNNLIGDITFIAMLKATISFSTVLPAIVETAHLIRLTHWFDKAKLKKHHKITKTLLNTMFALGIISLILPFIFPHYAFPLVWISLFFLLDPINYLHKQPSIISHLKDGKLKTPFSLIAAGTICGFLWEFWNYFAITKWTYSIPYVGFFKIFEMPILGYLGYGPFALELYAMYHFIGTLHKEEKKISHTLTINSKLKT